MPATGQTFKTLNFAELCNLLPDVEIGADTRKPTGPYDWGDPATIGKHLKHHGASVGSPWNQYGRYLGFIKYLGKHDVGYVVAVKAGPEAGPDFFDKFASGEVFESIEDMKTRWQLD